MFVGDGPPDELETRGPPGHGPGPALLPGRRQPATRGSRRAPGAHPRVATRPTGTGGPSRGSSRRCSRPPPVAGDRELGAALRRDGPALAVEPPLQRRRPALAARHEAPGRGARHPARPRRARDQARPGRHPRHRVHRPAAPAGARPRRRRPPLAEHARWPSTRWPTPATSTPTTPRQLVEAHRFLRTVEHRLQLVDEQQVHTVPDRRRPRSTTWPGCSATATRADGDAAERLLARAAPPPARGARHPRARLLPPAARGVRRHRRAR